MIKENKLKYLISSILIILPSFVSLFLKGSVDKMMWGAWYFTWIMPLVLFAVHTVMLILTRHIDPVRQSKKIENIVFFIIPALSLYVSTIFIAIMLGFEMGLGFICSTLLGGMFIIMGNYLPKARRNRTFGIKVTWAMANDDNWIATHRLSGKLFIIAGIVSFISGFLPNTAMFIVFIVTLLAIVVIPTVYSYCFYRRQVAEGVVTKEDYRKNTLADNKKALIATVIVIASLVVIITPLMFAGKISFELRDDALSVKPSFGGGIDIAYSELDVENIEYRDEKVPGSRIMGYGSAKLLYGQFTNDEFGNHTRYTYTNSESAIIIRVDSGVLVLADETTELTKALYDGLVAKVSAAK